MENAKKRILCVEQNVNNCEMLAKFLKILGYEVVSADNAADALRITRQEQFDVYVLDNELPDMNGLDLSKQILALKPDSKIIFYSSVDAQADNQQSINTSRQALLKKPANIEEVEKVIMPLLKPGNGSG